MVGLLDGLTDPELMAEVAERSRLIDRIAEQMGVSRRVAADSLLGFETVTSSAGQTVH